MERSAVAYLARGKLILAPVIRTSTGLGLEVDPVVVGDVTAIGDIARAIGEALASSTRVVPHPAQDQWRGFFEPFQIAVGVRSHKAFMKDARRISIRASGDHLKLTPQRNLGSKGGFEPIPEDAVVLPSLDLDNAAVALANLFT